MDAHGETVSDDELMALYADIEGAGKSGEYRRYRDVLRNTVIGICERLDFEPSASEAECLAESLGNWQPFDDTVDALRRLQSRYKLCNRVEMWTTTCSPARSARWALISTSW